MIRLSESRGNKPAISFEVFPPKSEKGMEKLRESLAHFYAHDPAFISCTCSAGGTGNSRNIDICRMIGESENGTVPLAHITCVRESFAQAREKLSEYLEVGIDHVLALRGDLPADGSAALGDFTYAADLVHFIRREFGDRFEVGIAGSPEGHVECESLEADIRHLKEKQDAGADFIVTQLTYDMEQFKQWLDLIRKEGVHLPVKVGVMPVLERNSIINICLSRNACAIPRSLAELLTRYWFDTDESGEVLPDVKRAFREEGVRYTANQIREYRSIGVDGIHLYTMNQWDGAEEILALV